MVDESFGNILTDEGFQPLGQITYRLAVSLWWHSATRVQVFLLSLGRPVLLKGCKSYYLESITTEGETWARDIPALQDYLEAHFPELHISFSHFRDVPEALIKTHLRRKLAAAAPTRTIPTVEEIGRLQRELAAQRRRVTGYEALREFDTGESDLLTTYGNRQCARHRQSIQRLEERMDREQERCRLFAHLQQEYQRHGAAACYVFSLSSNLQVLTTPDEFRDALRHVLKELTDAHRYQVTQKLCGGRLNIQVAEAHDPELAWIEQWLGGALSPRQLERLDSTFDDLRAATDAHLMVTTKEDISVEGHVKESRKRLAARVVSTWVSRLDRPEQAGLNLENLPPDAMPMTLGVVMRDGRSPSTAFVQPLAQSIHVYISGTTGSGKSYTGRVVVEEAAQYKQLSILVLDPRNQAVGLLVPEDRDTILDLYGDFGLRKSSARGFAFDYYAPGLPTSEPLPADLGQLADRRSIVSFKGMTDRDRCIRFAEILDAVFDACAVEESETPRLLIVIEEAQRFTKKRVADDAKAAGERAENALDRTVREGRKYGCCVVIVSQTIRDFAYDSASIRQNTNTKVFLHNSDREIDYAADFIGDGRQLVRLQTGTAIIHNAAWGAVPVKIRPPFSKVWEFSEEDTRKLIGQPDTAPPWLSADAQRLVDVAREHHQQTGAGLNLTQAAERLGITSKRALNQLIDEAQRSGLVRTRKLRERGQPRIIEPISSAGAGERPDET